MKVRLEVAETRKGTLQRLQWVIAELSVRPLRDAQRDRPDLATNPVSVTIKLEPRSLVREPAGLEG